MSDPVTRALAIGQAAAAVLVERAADVWHDLNQELTTTVSTFQSEWDKFNADVMARADAMTVTTPVVVTTVAQADLQASLDELRAEVAQLRSELHRYRSQSA